jgi:hypothetical protein
VLYVDFSSIVFRFKAKIKGDLVKTKDGPGSDKKIFGPGPDKNKKCRPGPEKKNYSDPGPGLGMPAAPYRGHIME